MQEGDLILPASYEKSLDKRVTALERQVERFFSREIEYNTLSEIVPDMGLVNAGEFRSGDGEPGDSFSGTRLGFPGFTYLDEEWVFVSVVEDVLDFGVKSGGGGGYFARGAAVVDRDGLTFTGLNYFVRFDADNEGVNRRLEMGTELDESASPVAYIRFTDPTSSGNLAENPGFEAGDLSEWVAVDTASSDWSADTEFPQAGSYAAKFLTTAWGEAQNRVYNGILDGEAGFTRTNSGTSYWVNGTTTSVPLTWVSSTGSVTGTMTTATGYRTPVTAGSTYNIWFRGAYQVVSGSPVLSVTKMDINWYDSSGSLLGTDTITATFTTTLKVFSTSEAAPANAVEAELVVTLTRSSASGSLNTFIDDLTIILDGQNLQTNGGFATNDFTGWATSATGCTWAVITDENTTDENHVAELSGLASGDTASLTTDLGTPDRIAVTAGKYYVVEAWSQRVNTPTFSTLTMSIKYYTATSGGSLVETHVINLDVSTAFVWFRQSLLALAPPTAAGAEIVVNVTCNGGTGSLKLDAFTFGLAEQGTLTTDLGTPDRMAVTAGDTYRLDGFAFHDISASSGIWEVQEIDILWYTATSAGSLVSTTQIPLTLTNAYANINRTLTAPDGAAGAEIKVWLVRDNSLTYYGFPVAAYFDSFTFESVDVATAIRFLPNVTIEGGPLDLKDLTATPDAPVSGYKSAFAKSDAVGAIDSSGNVYAMGKGLDAAPDYYWLPGREFNNTSATAAFVGSANQTRFVTFVLERPFWFYRLGIRITTLDAGDTFGAAIYTSDGNTRLVHAEMSTGSSGAITSTASAPVLIMPGVYIAAWTCTSTTAAGHAANNMGASLFALFSAMSLAAGTAANAGSSGVCPTTLGTLTETDITVPVMLWKPD